MLGANRKEQLTKQQQGLERRLPTFQRAIWADIQELLDKVAVKNPQKALELLLKLSEFVLPKLRAIEVNNESEEAMHTSLNINIIDTGVPLASCEADVVDVTG